MKKLTATKKEKQARYANSGKTKSRNRLLHLMRRFQERHGYIVSALDLENILLQIKGDPKNGIPKTADFIERDEKAFIYKVTCRNKEIAVVIDKAHKTLLTTYKLQERHYQMIERRKKAEIARNLDVLFAPVKKEIIREGLITKFVVVVKKLFTFMKGEILR